MTRPTWSLVLASAFMPLVSPIKGRPRPRGPIARTLSRKSSTDLGDDLAAGASASRGPD